MTHLINTFSNLDIKKSNTYRKTSKNTNNKKTPKINRYKFDCIEVKSVEDLGEYIRIDYDENTNCIRLFRDWKSWKYKNQCKKQKKIIDRTDKVFNYFVSEDSCSLHKIFKDDKKLLSFESDIVEELKLKGKHVRLSGNYLKATQNNSLTINLFNDYQIREIQKRFIKKEGEDVSEVFGIPIDKKFYFKKIGIMIKNKYGPNVKIGHHLKVAIGNFNYGNFNDKKESWKNKVEYKNMNLLVILEEYPDGKKEVNIPGGKRELGESSLNAGIRETNEEVIDRLIDQDTQPVYSFPNNGVDVFVFTSIKFLDEKIKEGSKIKSTSKLSELSDVEFLEYMKVLYLDKKE